MIALVEPTSSLRLFAIFLLVQIFIVEERRRSSRLRNHQEHVRQSARCLTASTSTGVAAGCLLLLTVPNPLFSSSNLCDISIEDYSAHYKP